MSQASKIALTVVITAIIVGGGGYYWKSCEIAEPNIETQKPKSQIYSSEKYYFEYPEGYSVSSSGGEKIETYYVQKTGKYKTSKSNDLILTVSKKNESKLEIFKAKEYPGDRAAFGFTGEETPAEAEVYMKEVSKRLPKEYLTAADYDVWLYYNENDKETKKELKAIFDSIIVK